MKKLVLVISIFVAVSALGQDLQVKHAAATVAHLHDEMLNPPTFALDNVFLTKADKHGNVSVCYEYRSQNVMGGMSEGRAVEWAADHGKLSTYQAIRADDVAGYNAGWVAPCKAKNVERDITKDVAALAPALYTKTK